ncbi:dolichol-phosphate mannosyltransferase subunit 3 [Daktulosphaira vitifoliae]|uniref:dolichol-phosphate mannosyltransferase subunit 3 n=1 Tax=Daktulosphaira vitifoliae TaxID=58002 RepID=UPI0021AA3AA4|nr:dolichol-phosphate mannosyltransferase subunit 3 [Daktulosphaira vitifoliae]
MNKLTEWLVGLNILSILWLSLLFNSFNLKLVNDYYLVIQFLPIVFLGIFGVSSLIIILYRVAIFNDCKSAAMDLQAEIKEAKSALQQKGFKFD